MSEGTIFDIQRFSLHDGPGIRTTVFLKGCPLECRWCQNPEGRDREIAVRVFDNLCSRCGTCLTVCPAGALTQNEGEAPRVDYERCLRCGACVRHCDFNAVILDGRRLSSEALLDELEKDRAFFDASGGGVTFSGGEPLDQADFVADVAAGLRERSVHTAVETALAAEWPDIETALPWIDLFIVDLKVVDPVRHQQLTGCEREKIAGNFQRLASLLRGTKRLWTRFTLVPGYAESGEALAAARFIASVDSELSLELMNFNPLAASKYRRLGCDDYEFYNCASPFSEKQLREFRRCASASGLTIK